MKKSMILKSFYGLCGGGLMKRPCNPSSQLTRMELFFDRNKDGVIFGIFHECMLRREDKNRFEGN